MCFTTRLFAQSEGEEVLLYGLQWDDDEEKEYLVQIDPQNGQINRINYLPEVRWKAFSSSTLNWTDTTFAFLGEGRTLVPTLYIIDLNTGLIKLEKDFELETDSFTRSGCVFSQKGRTMFCVDYSREDDSWGVQEYDPVSNTHLRRSTINAQKSSIEGLAYNAESSEIYFARGTINKSGQISKQDYYVINADNFTISNNVRLNKVRSHLVTAKLSFNGKVYCLLSSKANLKHSLFEIDPVSGHYKKLSTIPYDMKPSNDLFNQPERLCFHLYRKYES